MNALTQRMREIRLAVAFMTRLPMGDLTKAPPLSKAGWAIPLAGLPVGLAAGLVLTIAAPLPAPAAGLLALIVCALMTGALHEDGLADVADGFGGGATRDRKLEIMRDSRIGTYGVLALVLIVGLKAVLLSALNTPIAGAVALAIASRATLPALMTTQPRARADGLGAHIARDMPPCAAGMALVLGALALILLGPVAALAVGGIMAVTSFCMAFIARHQIGGITGDVLGATQILAETSGLMVFLALGG